MRIAILESIVMPAGHEVEFDRILVDELKRQGHEPVLFVPENFPFKIKYDAAVEYLSGGEVVTYTGANRFQKIFLAVKRHYRRKKWFNSAYEKISDGRYDYLIIPTATFRYLKNLLCTKLKNSPIPVAFCFHGINPREKANFVKQAKACEKYKNIKLKILTLRDDFTNDSLNNVDVIAPSVFKPLDFSVIKKITIHVPLILGFYGQYRREKNIRFFLDAFKKANFSVPVKLIMQGATARAEDSEEFEKISKEYEGAENIEFLHKNLIGKEWQKALLDADILIAPYAAERYRYHYSAMLFTAIGFYKPILTSPEMNPEILDEYKIGEKVELKSVEMFARQLEHFINHFTSSALLYEKELDRANEKYSQAELIRNILN